MYGVRHALSHEFPQYQEEISYLKHHHPDFARLLAEYDGMDKKIYGFERQMRPVPDEYMARLKRQRVRLKDRLFQILQHHREEQGEALTA